MAGVGVGGGRCMPLQDVQVVGGLGRSFSQLLISPAEASVLLVLDGRGLGGLCAGL